MGALPILRPSTKGVNANCIWPGDSDALPGNARRGRPRKGDGPARCVGSVLGPAGAARVVREAGAVVVVVAREAAAAGAVVTREAGAVVTREARAVVTREARAVVTREARAVVTREAVVVTREAGTVPA